MAGYADRFWTSHDGLRLHARDYAGAPGDAKLPVVCLHGLSRNARDFEDVAPAIAAQGRRVLVPDIRGRGLSDWDPDPGRYILPVYARDVTDLARTLGIARAVFIGTSMGGLITMLLASMGELVAAAVLNDIGPDISPVGLARIASYTGRPAEIADWEQATDYARAINVVALPGYQAQDWRAFARRLFRERDGRPVLDYDPAISQPLKTQPSGVAPPDLWPLFTRLAERPVMVVRGALSDLLDVATSERMRNTAPTVRLVEAAGVGHAPMLTEVDVSAALAGFLADQP